jgi:hypothetical protein
VVDGGAGMLVFGRGGHRWCTGVELQELGDYNGHRRGQWWILSSDARSVVVGMNGGCVGECMEHMVTVSVSGGLVHAEASWCLCCRWLGGVQQVGWSKVQEVAFIIFVS